MPQMMVNPQIQEALLIATVFLGSITLLVAYKISGWVSFGLCALFFFFDGASIFGSRFFFPEHSHRWFAQRFFEAGGFLVFLFFLKWTKDVEKLSVSWMMKIILTFLGLYLIGTLIYFNFWGTNFLLLKWISFFLFLGGVVFFLFLDSLRGIFERMLLGMALIEFVCSFFVIFYPASLVSWSPIPASSLRLSGMLLLLASASLEIIRQFNLEKTRQQVLAQTSQLLSLQKDEIEKRNRDLLVSYATLAKLQERYSLIIETANDAFLSLDENGVIREWNQRAEVLFGMSKKEASGQKLSALVLSDDLACHLQTRMKEYLEKGADPILNQNVEVKAYNKKGEAFPVEISMSIFPFGEGYSFNIFVRDITERKKSENLTIEQARQLKESNHDLEQFAYVASHDLQEPLRMITGFGDLLEKKLESQDEKTLGYLHHVVDGAKRMQQMISNLLEYSRATKHEQEIDFVNSNEALECALKNLSATIQETKVEIKKEVLPQVRAYQGSLERLFQNLISNAIKFKRDKNLLIEIKSKDAGSNYIFSIADNGIGIEKKDQDKIFDLFAKLHAHTQFSGFGIGLAVCKRIVESHGGQVWVDSAPGQGTTISFSWPKEGSYV
ncbi:MAG: hypothetical protein A3G32_08635 [Deltaproteobacteria bacterium RIFCSPLOWO2_12_FULL_40_28]|nr:MAG: hypothetical protein A3C45_01335 [Deltaproteobacteria bacterium RIFCSPHIGHO2_02_FULL_40_28]OGQ20970.1 MAG: hypothetical protein A3E27_04000 [Deltaproteobacteria bacterium RIFCSPHIGHO2_12_FULL_40_32]OGQ39371.1 MAG: hypothetical protein A3I69_05360 [Deltaproteobacteria bacterium RIFCSPLOWO2_02_FULL_40_36]OGQ54652.1 MAG: hypothetical protein A3G32_08635 [Deltaproteobacteria bacterium RIFCSPLOWO2_12_FULL_40_28]